MNKHQTVVSKDAISKALYKFCSEFKYVAPAGIESKHSLRIMFASIGDSLKLIKYEFTPKPINATDGALELVIMKPFYAENEAVLSVTQDFVTNVDSSIVMIDVDGTVTPKRRGVMSTMFNWSIYSIEGARPDTPWGNIPDAKSNLTSVEEMVDHRIRMIRYRLDGLSR